MSTSVETTKVSEAATRLEKRREKIAMAHEDTRGVHFDVKSTSEALRFGPGNEASNSLFKVRETTEISPGCRKPASTRRSNSTAPENVSMVHCVCPPMFASLMSCKTKVTVCSSSSLASITIEFTPEVLQPLDGVGSKNPALPGKSVRTTSASANANSAPEGSETLASFSLAFARLKPVGSMAAIRRIVQLFTTRKLIDTSDVLWAACMGPFSNTDTTSSCGII
mmetsp:Transcript_3810/g.14149  ORF Transcript_3810/g.14149 Transcript_3810/m.14149 type:complete len:224 (-) Transcript_3810:1518-2189(-)